jgi:hypothetical protein
MATKIGDLLVTVGTYTDGNGKEKSRVVNLGTLWQDGNRVYGHIPGHFLPVPLALAAQRTADAYLKKTGKAPRQAYEVQFTVMAEKGAPAQIQGASSNEADPSSDADTDSDDGINF